MSALLASLEKDIEELTRTAGPDSQMVQEMRQQLASLRAASPQPEATEQDQAPTASPS